MMDGPGRPLSPFLIYRWGVTNTLSILHRMTGVFMAIGLTVLICWLIALASGPEAYARVAAFYGGAAFRWILAAWVLCFFYHLANGVRHLAWDTGRGFDRARIRQSGALVVVFAVVATAIYVAVGLF